MRKILNLLLNSPNFISELVFNMVRNNDSLIASFLRSRVYRTQCMIDTNVFIKNKKNFTAGQKSALYHLCYILNTTGKFIIGKNSHLGAFCYVNVCFGTVTIGDDVAIGPGTKIIAYSNHYAKGKKVTEEKKVEDIIIGNNVFIRANCTILPGAVIHNNIIVAAGSVVNGTLEANTIYGGTPCKKIKRGWYA